MDPQEKRRLQPRAAGATAHRRSGSPRAPGSRTRAGRRRERCRRTSQSRARGRRRDRAPRRRRTRPWRSRRRAGARSAAGPSGSSLNPALSRTPWRRGTRPDRRLACAGSVSGDRGERLLEAHAASRERVEMGCRRARGAVAAEVIGARGVERDEDDARTDRSVRRASRPPSTARTSGTITAGFYDAARTSAASGDRNGSPPWPESASSSASATASRSAPRVSERRRERRALRESVGDDAGRRRRGLRARRARPSRS